MYSVQIFEGLDRFYTGSSCCSDRMLHVFTDFHKFDMRLTTLDIGTNMLLIVLLSRTLMFRSFSL